MKPEFVWSTDRYIDKEHVINYVCDDMMAIERICKSDFWYKEHIFESQFVLCANCVRW